MSDLSWALLTAATLCALFDWAAVAVRNKGVEYVAKPATVLLLLAVTLSLDAADDTKKALFVVALAFSAAGDVFLMLPERFFVAGLTSFLVAHLSYIAGFVARGVEKTDLIVWAGGVGVIGLFPAFLVLRAAFRTSRRLGFPVALYVGAITAMVVSAGASGSWVAVVGAILFYLSDTMIGVSRFVRDWALAPVTIIVTYHLGQTALVLSLIE